MSDNSVKLLEKIIAKIDELKRIDSDNYENFNILSILGKEADEVVMCKVLWAILDHKINGQRELLKGFIKDVLKMSLIEQEYDSAIVYREYCIPDNSRRIDLVIKTQNHFIPIEAKIYAEDQAKQCADYIRFAGRYYNSQDDVMLYYLTIDKHKPSLSSIDGDAKLMKQIELVSWEQILEWLNSERDNVEAMSDIVLDLKRKNWSDEKIAKELGMDSDEVLRLAQITGLAEMFADKDFSEAWECDFEDKEMISEEKVLGE